MFRAFIFWTGAVVLTCVCHAVQRVSQEYIIGGAYGFGGSGGSSNMNIEQVRKLEQEAKLGSARKCVRNNSVRADSL